MSKFLTWVTNKASEITDTDMRHKNRTIEYLNSSEINGKSMYDIVQYIKKWWPRALKDEIVLEKLTEIVEQHMSDASLSDIYDSTCLLFEDDSETLQYIQYVFSHVPLLFFEKDELFHRFGQYSPDVRTYYQSLSEEQKAKYAAKALTLNGYLLRDVPMSNVANKQGLYEIAVHSSPGAIKNVPIKNRTDDMMRNAVCKYAYALEHLTQEKQDEFLEDAIMNPSDEHETHWPSDIWYMVYEKVDNHHKPYKVQSGRTWLQKILNRVDRLKLVGLYIAWHKKRKEKADRQMNEQATI